MKKILLITTFLVAVTSSASDAAIDLGAQTQTEDQQAAIDNIFLSGEISAGGFTGTKCGPKNHFDGSRSCCKYRDDRVISCERKFN